MNRRLTLRPLLLASIACASIACALDTTGNGPATSDEAHGAPIVGAPDAAIPAPDAGTTGPAADGGGAISDDGATPIDAAEVDAWSDDDVHVLDPDAATPDGGDRCDLDQDGHRAAGATCGGDDCCDYDGRAFPGQAHFFATPDACGAFDYDCDGALTPATGIASCKLGFFSCSGDGFDQATACGAVGDFTSCGWAVVTCSKSTSPRTQACR